MNRATTSILMLVLMFDLENAAMLNTTHTTTNAQAKINDAKCEGWKYFESKCYELFHKEKYFYTSRQECIQKNGDLVSIKSKKENDFISKLIALSSHSEAWIGYEQKDGKYKWVDDNTPASYTNWMNNKPNGDGRCTEMIAGGEWVNILCFNKQSFVCKRDPMPVTSKNNLRLILTITISVSCIFIMFIFVGFLCVKSHKELEAVETQVKETIPFEIVKAAMVLPMSKPPDLLDHKVKNTWQGTIKSISKHKSDRDVQTFSTFSQEDNSAAVKTEVVVNEQKGDENERRTKGNLNNCLNRRSTSSKGIPKISPNEIRVVKPDEDKKSIENQPKLIISSSPSFNANDAISLDRPSTGDTNYLSKVDKWLKESPESPTRRHCVRESSVRRKHFQQSRGSQKGKAIPETPELEIDYPFNDETKPIDSKNTLSDVNLKKTIQRQNVISVTADVNMPRNNSSDIEIPYSTSAALSPSDNENGKSPSLSNGKRRKRAVFAQPDEIINDNFLFLKTLNYSQETDYSDLSEQRNEEKLEDPKLPDDHKHDNGKPDNQDPVSIIRENQLKEEYQLVTFV